MRLLSVAAGVCLVVGACGPAAQPPGSASPPASASGAPSASAPPSSAAPSVTPPSFTPAPIDGEFGPGTVLTAIDILADAGVTVRLRPGEDPLAPVEDPSGIELLRFQVRNLALEANAGGGTLGADLDTLTVESGGLPLS